MKTVLLALIMLLAASAAVAGQDCEFERTEDRCGVCAIYHEGRGEGELGQLAVAQVILNRVASKKYPNTVCEVVWQWAWVRWKEKETGKLRARKIGQFSFTQDGRSDKMKERAAIKKAEEMWILINVARAESIDVKLTGIPRSALFYHTTAVKPSWRQSFTVVAHIGDHLFYRP